MGKSHSRRGNRCFWDGDAVAGSGAAYRLAAVGFLDNLGGETRIMGNMVGESAHKFPWKYAIIFISKA